MVSRRAPPSKFSRHAALRSLLARVVSSCASTLTMGGGKVRLTCSGVVVVLQPGNMTLLALDNRNDNERMRCIRRPLL